jgi:hypothetical protein
MLGAHGSRAWLQRHVGAAPPDPPYRVLHSQVPLLVEGDRAQHGVELVLPQGAIIAGSSSEPAFSEAAAQSGLSVSARPYGAVSPQRAQSEALSQAAFLKLD